MAHFSDQPDVSERKPIPNRRILYIQARNLGDAVIGTGLLEALGRSDPSQRISVLTRLQFREIYENNPFVSEVFYASFPMGTVKYFGFGAGLRLLRTLAMLRQRRFDRVVHVSGDLRENLLGRMISPAGNTGVSWSDGHPQVRLVRRGFEACVPNLIRVPADDHNIYSAVQRVATSLDASAPAEASLYDADGVRYLHCAGSDRIGVQPTASQECKLWPREKWRELIGLIRAQGLRVVVYGAPSERAYLESCLPDGNDAEVEILTGSLSEFFRSLQDVRAFIGLDSFGVHAARAIGTPSIVFHGATIATVYTPPEALVVRNLAPPACFPCMNRPTCSGEENLYSCIRDIPVAMVFDRLNAIVPLN